MLDHYKDLDHFYRKFIGKLQVFDPLDRMSDESLAIKSKDLIDRIKLMPFVKGGQLEATLSDSMVMKLEAKFED